MILGKKSLRFAGLEVVMYSRADKEEDLCPTKNQTLLFQLVVSHLTDMFFEYRFVFQFVLSRYLVSKCLKIKGKYLGPAKMHNRMPEVMLNYRLDEQR
jgi:hypothetical protein